MQEEKVLDYCLVPIKTDCSHPQSAFTLSREVVIVHALAVGSPGEHQADSKSELRVNVYTDGFTRSSKAGP